MQLISVKEAMKPVVEYLDDQLLWVWLKSTWGETEHSLAYCYSEKTKQQIAKIPKILLNTVPAFIEQHKLAVTSLERGEGGPSVKDKYIRVSSYKKKQTSHKSSSSNTNSLYRACNRPEHFSDTVTKKITGFRSTD